MKYDELLGRINRRMSTVCVVGLGYVGVPVLRAFREAKFPVCGYDVDGMRIMTVSAETGIPCTNKCPSAEIYIVCVPTPVTGSTPDLTCLHAVADTLPKDCMVVVESTVGPGDTERLFADKAFVAFSPEREDPGNGRDLVSIPKVIAANDYQTQLLVTALYSRVFKGLLHMTRDIKTAEMAKLMENTYRAVNIALACEFRDACRVFGIDAREATKAAATKPFGYQAFNAGIGVGGHCIPVDPYYLLHNTHRETRAGEVPAMNIIRTAMAINAATPWAMAHRIAIEGFRSVFVIGATYKRNIDDVRNSPAAEFISNLYNVSHDTAVTWYDERAPESFKISGTGRCRAFNQKELFHYDAAVLAVDHDDFDYSILHGHPRIYDFTGRLPYGEPNIHRV